jgi:hypothetical protein
MNLRMGVSGKWVTDRWISAVALFDHSLIVLTGSIICRNTFVSSRSRILRPAECMHEASRMRIWPCEAVLSLTQEQGKLYIARASPPRRPLKVSLHNLPPSHTHLQALNVHHCALRRPLPRCCSQRASISAWEIERRWLDGIYQRAHRNLQLHPLEAVADTSSSSSSFSLSL